MKRIDCGSFAVWSYRRPNLHTLDSRRLDGPFTEEWSYCLRSEDGVSWKIGSAVSGFKSEAEAREAGARATFVPRTTEWRCRKCGGEGVGETCSTCGGTMSVYPESAR